MIFQASELAAKRIQEVRKRRGWTAKELADRCTALGAPKLTASVIANIESGRKDKEDRRRREITLDEWLILARALDAAPIHILVPPEGGTFLVAGEALVGNEFRAWVRGDEAPVGVDPRIFYSEVPRDEWTPEERGQRWRQHRESLDAVRRHVIEQHEESGLSEEGDNDGRGL